MKHTQNTLVTALLVISVMIGFSGRCLGDGTAFERNEGNPDGYWHGEPTHWDPEGTPGDDPADSVTIRDGRTVTLTSNAAIDWLEIGPYASGDGGVLIQHSGDLNATNYVAVGGTRPNEGGVYKLVAGTLTTPQLSIQGGGAQEHTVDDVTYKGSWFIQGGGTVTVSDLIVEWSDGDYRDIGHYFMTGGVLNVQSTFALAYSANDAPGIFTQQAGVVTSSVPLQLISSGSHYSLFGGSLVITNDTATPIVFIEGGGAYFNFSGDGSLFLRGGTDVWYFASFTNMDGALTDFRAVGLPVVEDSLVFSETNIASNTYARIVYAGIPPPPLAPQITCSEASDITPTSASMNGELISDGGGATTVWLYWGTNDGQDVAENWENAVSFGQTSPGSLTTNITGLSDKTTYFYRFFAANSAHEVWASPSSSFVAEVQPENYVRTASGDWGETTTWNPNGTPGDNPEDTAFINGPDLENPLVVTNNANVTLSSLWVGGYSGDGGGVLQHVAGTFHATDYVQIGSGRANESGVYKLSGGTLVTPWLKICPGGDRGLSVDGLACPSTYFIQAGGVVDVEVLSVGYENWSGGSPGCYLMADGTLSVSDSFKVGDGLNGRFEQQGGGVTSPVPLELSASSCYVLSGGRLVITADTSTPIDFQSGASAYFDFSGSAGSLYLRGGTDVWNFASLTAMSGSATDFRVDSISAEEGDIMFWQTNLNGMTFTEVAAPGARDTDGDGISDKEEAKYALTDPMFAEFDGTFTNAIVINGADTSARLGDWIEDFEEGTEILSQNRRGYVEYQANITQADVYRLEVEGTQAIEVDGGTKHDSFKLIVHVDGEYVGKDTLEAPFGTYDTAHFYTPWLTNGTHTIRIYWDNVYDRTSLKIRVLRLQRLGGPDTNSDGIKDWVETRLNKMNSVSFAPTGSVVSPVCMEGKGRFLSKMVISGGIEPLHGAGHRWYADVPLSHSSPTNVVVSCESGIKTVTNSIAWQALDLLTAENTPIRKGDSLLLTAVPEGATGGVVTIEVAGVTNYETTIDQPVVHQFDMQGEFTVTGTWQDGGQTQAASITVTVMSSEFPEEEPGVWLGQSRYWDCPDLSPDVVLDMDPTLEASLSEELEGGGCQLQVLVNEVDDSHYLLARTAQGGSILASKRMAGFWLEKCVDGVFYLVDTLEDGSRVIEDRITTAYLPDYAWIYIEIFAGGGVFENGHEYLTIEAEELDELGETPVRIIMPPGSSASPCHITYVYNTGEPVGSTLGGYNSGIDHVTTNCIVSNYTITASALQLAPTAACSSAATTITGTLRALCNTGSVKIVVTHTLPPSVVTNTVPPGIPVSATFVLPAGCSDAVTNGRSVTFKPPTTPGWYTVVGTFSSGVGRCGIVIEPYRTFTVSNKFCVIKSELKSIEFTSDHEDGSGDNLLQDYTDDFEGTGTAFPEPEWVKGGDNNPISHTRDTKISVKVKIKVEPAGVVFDLKGDDPDNYVDFNKAALTSTAADQEIEVTADANLPNQVDVLTKSIDWTIIVGTLECAVGTSGGHKIYVTWDTPTPAADLTLKRIDWACNIAKSANSITKAAEKFRDAIGTTPGYSPPRVWNLNSWNFLDSGDHGDCITLAALARVGLEMIGIPADYCWSYPTADGTPGFPAVNGNSCRTVATKVFQCQGESFNAKLVYPGNNFEGFFTVSDPSIKAYTVYTEGGPFENQTYYYLEVLRFADAPGEDQFWVWDYPNPPYTCTKNGVTVTNWVEVPGSSHITVPAVP